MTGSDPCVRGRFTGESNRTCGRDGEFQRHARRHTAVQLSVEVQRVEYHECHQCFADAAQCARQSGGQLRRHGRQRGLAGAGVEQ